MQYDIYHMHMKREDPFEFFRRHTDRIGHVQFTDAARRGKPGTESIDFARLFDAIERSGHRGYLGAKDKPSVATPDCLDQLKQYS